MLKEGIILFTLSGAWCTNGCCDTAVLGIAEEISPLQKKLYDIMKRKASEYVPKFWLFPTEKKSKIGYEISDGDGNWAKFHIAKHDVELSGFSLKSANKKLESSEMYTQQIARDNYDIIHNPNVRIKYPTLFREVSEHDKSSTSSWYDLSSKAYSEWQEYVKDKSIGYIK